MPSFIVAAFAPIVYAYVIEHLGEAGALYLCIGIALVILAAAVTLKMMSSRGKRSIGAHLNVGCNHG